MNRTVVVAAWLCSLVAGGAAAQAPAAAAPPAPQADPVDELVAAMRAREAKLKSVVIEMSTAGRLPGGEEVTTRGVLHVLRGEQPAIHTRFDYAFGTGIRGRAEMVQNAAGIVMFEDDPAFGEVFLQIDARLVADLEWAGRELQRDDLPGMAPREGGKDAPERRASSPLGSALLAAARRQFDLKSDARTGRGDEPGTWLVGKRRPGLDVQDPELPVADRVELFVRTSDLALLELKQFAGDTVLQHLVVDKLVVDAELGAKVFQVDAGGLRPRPVQQYPPLAESIEQAIKKAEARSKSGEVRPSRR